MTNTTGTEDNIIGDLTSQLKSAPDTFREIIQRLDEVISERESRIAELEGQLGDATERINQLEAEAT